MVGNYRYKSICFVSVTCGWRFESDSFKTGTLLSNSRFIAKCHWRSNRTKVTPSRLPLTRWIRTKSAICYWSSHVSERSSGLHLSLFGPPYTSSFVLDWFDAEVFHCNISTRVYHRHIFRPPTLLKMPFKRMKMFFFQNLLDIYIFSFLWI